MHAADCIEYFRTAQYSSMSDQRAQNFKTTFFSIDPCFYLEWKVYETLEKIGAMSA